MNNSRILKSAFWYPSYEKKQNFNKFMRTVLSNKRSRETILWNKILHQNSFNSVLEHYIYFRLDIQKFRHSYWLKQKSRDYSRVKMENLANKFRLKFRFFLWFKVLVPKKVKQKIWNLLIHFSTFSFSFW